MMTEPLLDAVIDFDMLGDTWPLALVVLIEAHEKRHRLLVTRKQIHVLIDRYAERYIAAEITNDVRRVVIRALRSRYPTRRNVYFGSLLSGRAIMARVMEGNALLSMAARRTAQPTKEISP